MAKLNIDQVDLDAYCDAILNDYENWARSENDLGFYVGYDIAPKYIRIWTAYRNGGKSSHSFVVNEDTVKFKRGDILKSASWKAPALNFLRAKLDDPKSWENVRWSGW